MSSKDVFIVMGSDSDFDVMKYCYDFLSERGILCDIAVMSAHRTPDKVAEFAKNARENGIKVIIAGAGSAAHLGGVIAAYTTIPVIGVPLAASDLKGMDALLSTVQMPAGIPVATVAIGKAGAVNAAILAMRILSVSDENVKNLLDEYVLNMKKGVEAKNEKLKSKL